MTDAYLAGFFDGEGCIHVGNCKGCYELRIVVANTCRRPLELFKAEYGGGITGPRQNSPTGRKYWTWMLRSHAASKALIAMLPYMRVKGCQAQLGIKFMSDFITLHRHMPADFRQAEKDRRLAIKRHISDLNQGIVQ